MIYREGQKILCTHTWNTGLIKSKKGDIFVVDKVDKNYNCPVTHSNSIRIYASLGDTKIEFSVGSAVDASFTKDKRLIRKSKIEKILKVYT